MILDILTERKTAPLPLPSSWTKWPKSALYIGEGEVHTYKYQVWQRGCGNDENVNGVQSLSSCLIKSIRWCRPPARPRDIPILPPTGSVQCTRWSPVTYITSDPPSALPRLGHPDEVKSRGILILLPHLHKGGLPWQFYITSSCAPVLTFGVTKYVFLSDSSDKLILLDQVKDFSDKEIRYGWTRLYGLLVLQPVQLHRKGFQARSLSLSSENRSWKKVSLLSCQGSRGSTRWSQQRRKWWRRRKKPQTFPTHRFSKWFRSLNSSVPCILITSTLYFTLKASWQNWSNDATLTQSGNFKSGRVGGCSHEMHSTNEK